MTYEALTSQTLTKPLDVGVKEGNYSSHVPTHTDKDHKVVLYY